MLRRASWISAAIAAVFVCTFTAGASASTLSAQGSGCLNASSGGQVSFGLNAYIYGWYSYVNCRIANTAGTQTLLSATTYPLKTQSWTATTYVGTSYGYWYGSGAAQLATVTYTLTKATSTTLAKLTIAVTLTSGIRAAYFYGPASGYFNLVTQ